MQLLTGDYVTQNVSIGFTWFFPAKLQRIRAQRGEDQGSRRTGSAQCERRALKETVRENIIQWWLQLNLVLRGSVCRSHSHLVIGKQTYAIRF